MERREHYHIKKNTLILELYDKKAVILWVSESTRHSDIQEMVVYSRGISK